MHLSISMEVISTILRLDYHAENINIDFLKPTLHMLTKWHVATMYKKCIAIN